MSNVVYVCTMSTVRFFEESSDPRSSFSCASAPLLGSERVSWPQLRCARRSDDSRHTSMHVGGAPAARMRGAVQLFDVNGNPISIVTDGMNSFGGRRA